MLDKSKSSVQDTKSTRNRTSMLTTELNKRVDESKQCTYSEQKHAESRATFPNRTE